MNTLHCGGCGHPRRGVISCFRLALGGPALDYFEFEEVVLCPRCRAVHRDVIRTDRQWTESEAVAYITLLDLEGL